MKERKRKSLLRSPSNCAFNEKIRIHGNGSTEICLLDEKKLSVGSGIFICDSEEICNKCKSYVCKNTEESIENEFRDIIRNPSVCGKEYPKLAILLWVLEGDCRKPKLLERIKGIMRKVIHDK